MKAFLPRMVFLSDELLLQLAGFYRRRYSDFRWELEVGAIELAQLKPGQSVTIELLEEQFHQKGRSAREVKATCVISKFQETGTDFVEVVQVEIDGVTIGTMPTTLPGAEVIAALAPEEVARA